MCGALIKLSSLLHDSHQLIGLWHGDILITPILNAACLEAAIYRSGIEVLSTFSMSSAEFIYQFVFEHYCYDILKEWLFVISIYLMVQTSSCTLIFYKNISSPGGQHGFIWILTDRCAHPWCHLSQATGTNT